jgi:hypothetical protein
VGASQQEAETILERKVKLMEKAHRDEAVGDNYVKLLLAGRAGAYAGDAVMSDTLFTGLAATLLYGIPLADVVPWQLLFRTEYPSLEEFLRGVLIRIERVAPEEVAPALETVEGTLQFVFSPDFWQTAARQIPNKAVYGKSRYDLSYFDPAAVRDFLRSTAIAVMKRGTSHSGSKEKMRSLADALGVDEAVAEDIFNRAALLSALREQGGLVGYTWVGVTQLTGGRVRFRAYDGSEVEVQVDHVVDALVGAYVGLSRVGLCSVTPSDYSKAPPLRYDPEAARYAIDWLLSLFTQGFRDRLPATALAAANYQTAEERGETVPPLAEVYALPASQAAQLEAVAEGVVRGLKPDVGPYELNLYKAAVRALYGELFSPHRWGAEAQRAMARDELKRYWVGRWAGAGLDAGVLDALFEAVYPTAQALGDARWSERLLELRRRLRLRG